jgi:hypothetical protein
MTSAFRVNLMLLDKACRFQPLSGRKDPGLLKSLCILMSWFMAYYRLSPRTNAKVDPFSERGKGYIA